MQVESIKYEGRIMIDRFGNAWLSDIDRMLSGEIERAARTTHVGTKAWVEFTGSVSISIIDPHPPVEP
jgi:hypothetical protein